VHDVVETDSLAAMRAFVFKEYGGPAVTELGEVSEPSARAGELLVRVHAVGLNPVDFKTRAGKLKMIRKYALPQIMGNELSGVVMKVGEGVTKFKEGDRIFARVDKDVLGALAEVARVHEDHAAHAPSSIDLETAAAVPLAGLTALQALRDELHVKKGDKVFISGGAGGVGTFAIQLAKWLGATVATTASPKGDALVRRLGADIAIDYTKAKFEDELHDYDAAFDLIGADTLARCFQIVKKGGHVLSINGMPEPTTAKKDLERGLGLQLLFFIASFGTRMRGFSRGVSYRYLFMSPNGAELAELAALIDEKKLEVVVDRVFPFAETREAFAYLEAGRAKGKVVVRVAKAEGA
jgi:NADPH:quinone reductase-like Zn-dependent oxidoreductase